MNFKDKSVLVIDRGLFVSLAERLVGEFGKVGYYTPWETLFPDASALAVGDGLPGIIRVKYLERDYLDYDLIVFPYVYDGWMVEDYRRRGLRVWGSGPGNELELLRWKTIERFKELGLPTQQSFKVRGINALRKFLQENETENGWYVKFSQLRGLGETWHAQNYAQSVSYLDAFQAKNGPIAYTVTFIIETPVEDADEIGYDGFNIDGQFPSSSMYGWEVKDKAYLGEVSSYDSLPENVRRVNDGLSPVLKQFQYRNFFSTELRDDICIDRTCRHATPGGEVLSANIENLPEILWFGGEGKLIQPRFKHKYGAQLMLRSEWAEDHALLVEIPDGVRPFTALYGHCRIDDDGSIGIADYVIPQIIPEPWKMDTIGSVIALADDPQEAINTCKERAEMVKGFKVECDADALDKALEELNSARTQSA